MERYHRWGLSEVGGVMVGVGVTDPTCLTCFCRPALSTIPAVGTLSTRLSAIAARSGRRTTTSCRRVAVATVTVIIPARTTSGRRRRLSPPAIIRRRRRPTPTTIRRQRSPRRAPPSLPPSRPRSSPRRRHPCWGCRRAFSIPFPGGRTPGRRCPRPICRSPFPRRRRRSGASVAPKRAARSRQPC